MGTAKHRRLTAEDAAAIMALYTGEQWEPCDIARRYGVEVDSVRRVISGKGFQAVTGGRNANRRKQAAAFRRIYIAARIEQAGPNYAVIAAELGITRQAVRQMAQRMTGEQTCSEA